MKIFSIYDKVAEEHGSLYEAKNEAVAIRMFKQLLANDLYQKTDYELHYLGAWNSKTGEITPIIPIISIPVQWSPSEEEKKYG